MNQWRDMRREAQSLVEASVTPTGSARVLRHMMLKLQEIAVKLDAKHELNVPPRDSCDFKADTHLVTKFGASTARISQFLMPALRAAFDALPRDTSTKYGLILNYSHDELNWVQRQIYDNDIRIADFFTASTDFLGSFYEAMYIPGKASLGFMHRTRLIEVEKDMHELLPDAKCSFMPTHLEATIDHRLPHQTTIRVATQSKPLTQFLTWLFNQYAEQFAAGLFPGTLLSVVRFQEVLSKEQRVNSGSSWRVSSEKRLSAVHAQ